MVFKQFILIFIFKYVFCNETLEINVGTVLFTTSDNTKKCWSNEELALIRSRIVFQDLLPKSSTLAMENDAFVSALIQYFKMAVERTKKMTAGKVREINMKALTDTLGGYLHHIILPLGKHAYYAGKICYDSAEQLYKLYDEMKSYLKTDGHGWAPPIIPRQKAKRDAEPLPSTSSEHAKDSCSNFIINYGNDGGIQIPMPFMDSKTNPSSIAVPFKEHPLRNIRSKSSAFILVQYYETAIACLQEKSASQDQIKKFSNELNLFVESEVMPHMHDEDLYPAFGSVYRLKETLGGLTPTERTPKPSVTESELISSSTGEYDKDEDKSSTIMFIAISVVILIWLLTGVIYCCCRMRRKHRDQEKHVIDGASLRRHSSTKAANKTESVKSSNPMHHGHAPEPYGSRRGSHRGSKPECKMEKGNKDVCRPSTKPYSTRPESTDYLQDDTQPDIYKNPYRAPIEKTPNKTPTKTPNKTPTKTPPKTPTKTSTKAPQKVSPKTSPTERKSGGGFSKSSGKSEGAQCRKCHRMKCGHGISETVANVREVKSAPLNRPFHPGKSNISSRTSTKQPVVYGYNIQTSSSNSSSSESDDDYSSSSDVPSKKV